MIFAPTNSSFSFISLLKKGMGASYSLEDKSKVVLNQVNLLAKEALSIYKKTKIKVSPQVVLECVRIRIIYC
jgi:hypothetical protein